MSKTAFITIVIAAIFTFAGGLSACKDDSGMKAEIATRESQAAAKDAVPASEIKPEDGSLPKTKTVDESPSIPSVITGSYLVCLSDPRTEVAAMETTVSCAMKSTVGAVNVDLTKDFVSHQWGYSAVADLDVSFVELPAASTWQVRFAIKALGSESVRSRIRNLRFTLSVVDLEKHERKMAVETNMVLPESPDDSFIHLKNQMDRCIDLSNNVVTPGTDFLTYGCNSAANQMLTLNASMQLTISGACMTFTDRGNAVVGSCTGANAAPSWIISGNRIQMWNTPLCLGSGAGVGRVVDCAASDLSQQWVVGKKVLNTLPQNP